jgi:hypothetical protein
MGCSSRWLVRRSLAVAALVLASIVALVMASTVTAAVQLVVATALIMGGTGASLDPSQWSPERVNAYIGTMAGSYIAPTHTGETFDEVAVITPEAFWPVSGSKTFGYSVAVGRNNLDNCVHASNCNYNPAGAAPPNVPDSNSTNTYIVLGYSQSAVIASLTKQDLINGYADAPAASPDVSFVLVSNPMRPNGGILMKATWLSIPVLNIPLYGATPTDTCETGGLCYPTVDVAQQYDILGGDAPNNLFNIVALANSIAGYLELHAAMQNQDFGDASVSQGSYGDTEYDLNPAELLPILMPLETLGVPRSILLAVDAPLRVLVEQAYRRDISPGEPTPQYLLPISDPFALPINLLKSIPVGIDDALQYQGLGRPLGTSAAGPYGVGGDDHELKGLPAGLIPLGSIDGTPAPISTSSESAAARLPRSAPDAVLETESSGRNSLRPNVRDGIADSVSKTAANRTVANALDEQELYASAERRPDTSSINVTGTEASATGTRTASPSDHGDKRIRAGHAPAARSTAGPTGRGVTGPRNRDQ